MDEYDKMLVEVEQRGKSNARRIDGLEQEMKEIREENKAIYEIATSVKVMAEKVGNIEEKVGEISHKVDETSSSQREFERRFTQKIADVEHEPDSRIAQNVNSIKVSIITGIVTFLVTGILGAIIIFVK